MRRKLKRCSFPLIVSLRCHSVSTSREKSLSEVIVKELKRLSFLFRKKVLLSWRRKTGSDHRMWCSLMFRRERETIPLILSCSFPMTSDWEWLHADQKEMVIIEMIMMARIEVFLRRMICLYFLSRFRNKAPTSLPCVTIDSLPLSSW